VSHFMELSVKVSHFMEGDLCVTSHISWKYGCIYIYIYIRNFLDTTGFKAVMTINLLKLRS
jgi:hypothetical protein